MKTRTWILVIASVLAVCIGLSLWLLMPGPPADGVKVISEGKLLYTLPLNTDTQVTVATAMGTNVITVKGGKVAVTEASCPDHYCMARGYCDRGAQIVCLPNRLVLEFTGTQPVDGVSG